PFRGLADDRLAQWMLRPLLRGRRDAQQLICRVSSERDDVRHRRRALRQRAGLVKTTVVRRCAFSRYSPPLMRRPFSAPLPVPTMIAAGVAIPSAHGQAMISTAMKKTRACAIDSPNAILQTRNVTTAMTITAGTNTEATRSARRWIGARAICASPTSLII